MERERAAGPPPLREHYVTGAVGDESFQADRASWYEALTGYSLRGDTLAQQNEEFDIIARRFRDYNDGRADIRERLRGEL